MNNEIVLNEKIVLDNKIKMFTEIESTIEVGSYLCEKTEFFPFPDGIYTFYITEYGYAYINNDKPNLIKKFEKSLRNNKMLYEIGFFQIKDRVVIY